MKDQILLNVLIYSDCTVCCTSVIQMMLAKTAAWICMEVIQWFLVPLAVVTASRRCPLAATCARKHPCTLQRNTEVHFFLCQNR